MPYLLSTPADSPYLPALKRLLLDEGADEVRGASSILISQSSSLAESIFEGVDALVALIPAEMSDGWASTLSFEIGFASGRGLPVLLVEEVGASRPAILNDYLSVRADLSNLDWLRLQIRIFLQSPPRATQIPSNPDNTPLTLAQLSNFRQTFNVIRETSASRQGLKFEELVVRLFRESGALISESESSDTGIDAAVVFPGTEKLLGPLLVEAKWAHHTTSRRMDEIEEQLMLYATARGARMGILIYDSERSFPNLKATPLVLQFWFPDLLDRLENQPLAKVLVDARNRAVHGI